jgi:GT2 family glycosyltransferase
MALSIEVIVPTLNRPDCIEKLIASILIQRIIPSKVTIVDAGSNSADYEQLNLALDQAGIRFVILKSKPGLTLQRNIGIQHIDCDIVVFSDDDVIFEIDYLQNLIKVFEEDTLQTIGGATGKMINFKDTTTKLSRTFRKLFYLGRLSDGSVLPSGFGLSIDHKNQQFGKVGWLSGCNMAYRREVFNDVWFDENLLRYAYMEDIDFSYRVSKLFKLVYIPDAGYCHYQAPQERLKDFDRYRMLVRHHHYLFQKNLRRDVKTTLPHYISLLGIVFQALLLQRSIRAFSGAGKGLIEILLMKKLPLT